MQRHKLKQNRKDLELFKLLKEPEEEDLQAMIFYSWLRSKVNRADFYSSVLDVVLEP